jgi:1-acyl-sn-glycerol-3-phosphate acyltransferase
MAIFLLVYGLSLLVSKHTPHRAFRLRRNWLRLANWFLWIKTDVKGSPPITPALYVSNHRSFSDPLVLLKYLDAYVIAKAEVSSYPLINKGAEVTGIVYVKREDRDSRRATRDTMINTIKSGYNVLVYPEGTVGKEKHTLPFKIGTFIEAAKEGIPVVPIAIEYKSPKDLWMIPNFLKQYMYQFSKWKTEVRLEFGPVLKSDDGEELHRLTEGWVNQKISEMQKGWSQSFKD